jgi:type I restriction enzyme, R subunit
MQLSQIQTVLHAFKDSLPEIFPGRTELPKTLILAKDDSDADDIIQVIRKEFAEGNDFCKKVTYGTTEDPKAILADFNNSFNPRIIVAIDAIVTDLKPLEYLIVVRDVLPPVPSLEV